MFLITHGTEWPILCWCAVKQLLIYSFWWVCIQLISEHHWWFVSVTYTVCVQGDNFSEKPGNVREFDSGQGKAGELTKSPGNSGEIAKKDWEDVFSLRVWKVHQSPCRTFLLLGVLVFARSFSKIRVKVSRLACTKTAKKFIKKHSESLKVVCFGATGKDRRY